MEETSSRKLDWMETKLRVEILPQPDDFTCGPTCLHALYRYFGENLRLEQVIGETSVIGDDVHLYHQVTLGGTGHDRGKRHPTIGDRVVIGAGAKVLGDIELGHDCAVGANAVVVRSAPPWSTLTGIPAEARQRRGAPVAESPDMADFYMI